MICIVSSCGGHLTEVRLLLNIISRYPHFYIINNKIKLSDDMKDKTFFISHSERDIKFIYNLFESLIIFMKIRPKFIVSTGAGPAVPVSLIGKYIFRSKIIFIESITRVNKPSLTGKIMYTFSDHFYYQWPNLTRYYKKGIFVGTLI